MADGFSLKFLVLVLLAWTIGFSAHGQESKPLKPQANDDAIQESRVIELKELQNEIALAYDKDKAKERDRLFELLQGATSETGGKYVADAIWQNWMASAPTAEVSALITKAMDRRRWHDFEGARLLLNQVVEKAPDYSEGWNQRAYILFLQEKLDESLADIDKALELEPRHFGALSGKARILFHQGRNELAQKTLKLAVDIHPWIYERFLLAKDPQSDQDPLDKEPEQTEL